MSRRLRTNARELTGQLVVLGIALWGVAIANSVTSTSYLRSGQIRGTDFVQFYTLGRLAAAGEINQFDDFDAIRATQLAAVPEATNVWFPPVYGPQVPLLLAPLGYFSYGGALAVWVIASTFLYLLLCWIVVVRSPSLERYRATAFIGALVFPAFWELLQHGQLAVLAVASVVGSWLCLRAGNRFAAGAILGLLVYKPPLLAPVLVILFLAGEWRMWVPAVAAAIAEVAITGFWVGLDGLKRYVLLMWHLPTMSTLLFTKPEQSHGLKAFWRILIPQPTAALALYLISAVAVVALAAAIWRRQRDPSVRMAAAILGLALAAPYLFVYDLTILAPVWLWLVHWFLTRDVPASVGRALYLGYLAPLAGPLVPLIHVQPSIPCLVFLLFALWKYRDAPELQTA